MRDYYTMVVADGQAAYSQQEQETALKLIDRFIGETTTMGPVRQIWPLPDPGVQSDPQRRRKGTDLMPTPSLQQIGNGIYAWIGANGNSNAGAVVTPSGLLAIDAQPTRALGSHFRSVIEKESGRPATQLIDTHFHLDHTAGNVVFADVPIVSHHKTRQAIENSPRALRGQSMARV